jgi:hypothetical protein
MAWVTDLSANRFNNTYFRDAHGTGFAVDMSGDLVVRGQIRNDDTSTTGHTLAIKKDCTNTWTTDNGAHILLMEDGDTDNRLAISYDNGPGTYGAGKIQCARLNVGGLPLCLQPAGGNVGIGTTSPNVPLDVATVVTGVVDVDDNNDGYRLSYDGLSFLNDSRNEHVCISAAKTSGGTIIAHTIAVGYGIHFDSDERIKKNITDINDDDALKTLRLIQPKIYNYKEQIMSKRSSEPVYGFIAQQIAEVLPHAVNIGASKETENYIPNLMCMCKVITDNGNQILEIVNSLDIDNIITEGTKQSYNIIDANKTTNDFEKDASGNISPLVFYDKNQKIKFISVTNVTDDSKFTIDETIESGELFSDGTIVLLGQNIHDFHNLNKDYIFTVATAALQEVDRQLQAEKAKTATLESQVAALLAKYPL